MNHELYMGRCLDLARLGAGNVAPNPLVGSVIVHDNKIIGEGFHQKYGEAHAEVNAINAVSNKELLRESTIYVNLEPCAHFGKTPPCADLISKYKIPQAAIGCIDSYSEVAGKGLEKMRSNGCDVTVGILEKESLELNKRFFTFHNKKRPYVILKWAQTKNGFIDINRSKNQEGIFWISSSHAKQKVHQWRHEESGILIGKNTLINDDPSLTVREVKGTSPTRFLLDSKNEIDLSKYKLGIEPPSTFKISGDDCASAKAILDFIFEKNIQSVIIEGGKTILETFIAEDLWDEARVIEGSGLIENGVLAPKLKAQPSKINNLENDQISYYHND